MAYQSNSNAVIAYKAQSGLGVPATGASGIVLRTAGGAGAKLSKAAIESNEIRADGMRSRGRHGSQKTSSSYNAELSLGSHDPILEAVMRGTWDTVVVSATQADMTSVTTTANAIVAVAGSWIAKGFRVGDIVRATGLPDATNNSRNLRITALTALVMTVAETLVVNAAADTTFSVTRPGKRLINPATPIKRYFTLDEYEVDLDQSTVLQDFVFSSIKFSMAPNGLVMADPGGMGTGQLAALGTAASPQLTSPTATTGAAMSAVDATVRFNGADIVALTAFDLTIDIGASAPDVVASKFAPDVFSGQMAVSMSLSMLRSDLSQLQAFVGETPLSLHFLAVDNTAEPKDFISIVVPNFTLGSVDPSALSKAGGGRTQSMSVPAALIGKDNSGGAFDPTMLKIQTTAP